MGAVEFEGICVSAVAESDDFEFANRPNRGDPSYVPNLTHLAPPYIPMNDVPTSSIKECPFCEASYTEYSQHFDVCPEHEREAERGREHHRKLAEKLGLKIGSPTESTGMASLEEAERQVKAFLQRDIEYDPQLLMESEFWWYIPHCWIGCSGFIVDKETGNVDCLGSGVSAEGRFLENCFWGHDHGLNADLVDFAFAPDTSLDLAKQIVSKFKHLRPNSHGMLPEEPVWYRDSELESAVAEQFPLFKRHAVWPAITDLRKAYEEHGLRFTVEPSREAF